MLKRVAVVLSRFWKGSSGFSASVGNRTTGVAAERIRRHVPVPEIGRNAMGGRREVQVLVRAATESPEDRVLVAGNETLMIDEDQVLGSGSDRASTVNEDQVLDLVRNKTPIDEDQVLDSGSGRVSIIDEDPVLDLVRNKTPIDEDQVLDSGSGRVSIIDEDRVLDLESSAIEDRKEMEAVHLFSEDHFLSQPSVDEIDPSERHVGGFETIQVRTSQCLTRNVNTGTLAVPSQHLDLSVDIVRLLPEWCQDFDCLRQFFFRDLPVWCASARERIQKCKNNLSQTRDPCLMRKQKSLIEALQDLKEIEKQKEKIQELLESPKRELLFASLGDFFEKFEKVKLQISEILSQISSARP